MTELAYTDFRSFIEEAKKISDFRIIENADWDAEIGALVESTAELVPQPPMLIFDKVKGYPAGYRVCSLPYAAYRRVALALGLPTDKPKLEILRLAARKIKNVQPIAPKEQFVQHIFGGSLGGPLINPGFGEGTKFDLLRDRAFFFVNLQASLRGGRTPSKGTPVSLLTSSKT